MQHPRRGIVKVAYLACAIAVLVLGMPVVSAGETSEKPATAAVSLEALRQKVQANEAKASLIRMDFRYLTEMDPPPEQPGGQRLMVTSDGEDARIQCVYAQDGQRVHSRFATYNGEEFRRGYLRVINGEVHKLGVLPDLMLGRIDRIENFYWGSVSPLRASFRPFADNHLLSRLLVPEHASIREMHATVDGRDAVVVEIKRPGHPGYYSRIWIDVERAMPLRMEHYHPDPVNADAGDVLGLAVSSIRLHSLPNGGWVPVESVSSLRRVEGGTHRTRLFVDVNSISINKEDIPDSLFDIQFPAGAKIQNMTAGEEK